MRRSTWRFWAVAALAACGARDWKAADARLAAAVADARASGYAPLAGPSNTFGTFRDASVAVWAVQLEAGHDYFLAGACTEGCTQLDFALSGPSGVLLAEDTTAGTTPRLAFVPAVTGSFEVQIRTGACTTDGCRWILQLYGR